MESVPHVLPPFDLAPVTAANWQQDNESYFIELMLEKVISIGENRVTGTFSKNEWADIRKKYYKKFGLKYELKAFKNKMTILKERYKDHKKLVEGQTGLGWDPVLCTVSATNEWWDGYVKSHPRAKRFRIHGCPEYEKLATIFGDIVATGNLQSSAYNDFNSTDGDEDIDEPIPSTFPVDETTTENIRNTNVDEGNMSTQNCRNARIPSSSTRRRKKESKGSEISEAIKLLVESSNSKVEAKNKYSIGECIEILDNMGEDVGRITYMRAMKLFQEQSWRETFLRLSENRRHEWVDSVEDGSIYEI